jgi:MarR family transcriptional regulator for hemolysin
LECTDDIGYLLNKAARLSKLKVNQKLGEIGLTFPQYLVVKHLIEINPHDQQESARTPASIAEHLGYDRPTVTGIIDRLVKQGFILRKTNPEDRRSQNISLTPKSQELIQTMEIIFKEVNDQSLAGFTGSEIEIFKSYLLRFIHNLDGPKGEPCCGMSNL